MKLRKTSDGRQYIMLPLGVGVCYAEKDSSLVLKWNTSWRKINGFWLNTKRGCWWFTFRRDKYL